MADAAQPEDLLPAVSRGDAEAVRACLDRYGGLVWSVAVRLLGAGPDAEDASQDVFIDLWKHAERFDPRKAKEATFVAMIARRRCIDRLRRRTTRADHAAGTTTGDAASLGSPLDFNDLPAAASRDEVEDREELRRIEAAMDDLPPPRPEVVRMAVCDGLTHPQIAERLGLPLGTVKAHVRRGLIALREALGAHAPAGVTP